MGTVFVDNLEPQSGTSLTLGASGDTVNLGSGGTVYNTPAFRATLTSDQTVSDNAVTKAQFSTEVYDTDGAYDHSTNYRFTVPSGKGGKYYISVTTNMQDFGQINHGGSLIFKNGSGVQHYFVNWSSSAYGDELSTTCCATLDLAAGDYIEAYVQFNSGDGGSPTVKKVDANGYLLSAFEGHRLIGA
jgi:hypothetical protein